MMDRGRKHRLQFRRIFITEAPCGTEQSVATVDVESSGATVAAGLFCFRRQDEATQFPTLVVRRGAPDRRLIFHGAADGARWPARRRADRTWPARALVRDAQSGRGLPATRSTLTVWCSIVGRVTTTTRAVPRKKNSPRRKCRPRDGG